MLRNSIRKFNESASYFQKELPKGSSLHCIATAEANSRTAAFCILSRLWTTTLDSGRIGSKFAKYALFDAFCVAKDVANEQPP